MKLSKKTLELAKELAKKLKEEGFDVEYNIKSDKVYIKTFLNI